MNMLGNLITIKEASEWATGFTGKKQKRGKIIN
jgi:hypothetical protein